jgi:hypothetical protein
MTRRQAIVSGAAAAVGLAAGWRAEAADQTSAITAEPMQRGAGETITGALSGRPVFIPDVNVPPMPSIAPPGPIYNGEPTDVFNVAKLSDGHPDACSYRRRFGLIIPATNTTMESELWNILVRNRDDGLDGIGLHTSTVMTPKPDVSSAKGIEQYRQHFLGGVNQAVKSALLAGPQYFILGMSLEHIISGIEPIRVTMAQIEESSELSWATWHDAAKAALERYGAKRIGLITPFERTGNESAARMFRDSGGERESRARSARHQGKQTRCRRAVRHEHEHDRRGGKTGAAARHPHLRHQRHPALVCPARKRLQHAGSACRSPLAGILIRAAPPTLRKQRPP